MNMLSMLEYGRCDALVEALRAEFGGILAERIVEAEAADFLWEARFRERYFGQHLDAIGDEDEATEEMSRVAVLSVLNGIWHVGICLVNGEGAAVDLVWKRPFGSVREAEIAFDQVR
jgi:hypothetical protein